MNIGVFYYLCKIIYVKTAWYVLVMMMQGSELETFSESFSCFVQVDVVGMIRRTTSWEAGRGLGGS